MTSERPTRKAEHAEEQQDEQARPPHEPRQPDRRALEPPWNGGADEAGAREERASAREVEVEGVVAAREDHAVRREGERGDDDRDGPDPEARREVAGDEGAEQRRGDEGAERDLPELGARQDRRDAAEVSPQEGADREQHGADDDRPGEDASLRRPPLPRAPDRAEDGADAERLSEPEEVVNGAHPERLRDRHHRVDERRVDEREDNPGEHEGRRGPHRRRRRARPRLGPRLAPGVPRRGRGGRAVTHETEARA